MIKIKDVSIVFGKNTPLENLALDNINLEIAASDFITLIGSNGAGKSTLLKLIAGEIFPTKGSIFFDKKDVTHLSVEKRARYIGYVYQNPHLGTCENFTVEENLAFAASRGARRGLSLALNRSLRKRFKSILVDLQMGLEDRLTDQVCMLSGGQRQALSLMMATLQPSKILLLDEHTAALDPKIASTILALTKQIVEQHHLTTIMITHQMTHALQMGSRTLLMQQGKIIQDLSGKERHSLKPEDLVKFF